MTTLDVDPRRAARAAEALRDGTVRIEAGEEDGTYIVRSFTRADSYRVRVNGELRCDCPDATYNGTEFCKHMVAVVLAAGLNKRRDR